SRHRPRSRRGPRRRSPRPRRTWRNARSRHSIRAPPSGCPRLRCAGRRHRARSRQASSRPRSEPLPVSFAACGVSAAPAPGAGAVRRPRRALVRPAAVLRAAGAAVALVRLALALAHVGVVPSLVIRPRIVRAGILPLLLRILLALAVRLTLVLL